MDIIGIDIGIVGIFLLFYLYGSIPYAHFFCWIFSGKKISEHLTGNVGVANAFRIGGYAAGFLTAIGEISKSLLPVIISRIYFQGDMTIALIFTVLTSLGTSFSIFMKGKGGLGTTILLYTLLIYSPITLLVIGALWLISSRLIKNNYRLSIANNILMPVVIYAVTQSLPLTVFGVIKSAIFQLKFKQGKDDIVYSPTASRLLGRDSKSPYLLQLEEASGASSIGNKAANLRYLAEKGYKIPKTIVCTTDAYEDYLKGKRDLLEAIYKELGGLLQDGVPYSVRSSSSLEDDIGHTFAGQFKTVLGVRGLQSVIEAIEEVWISARSDRVLSYCEKVGCSFDELKMAVIIQEMVLAEHSGVVFTKNPLNGRDEIIIEAVEGVGDSLVQVGMTPLRWVYKWGKWIEIPEASSLGEEILEVIKKEARELEKDYGSPLNLEWAYDGKRLYWLQLRAVTTIGEINFFSNNIPKMFLPGMVKPLVWSVAIPVVCGAWIRLINEAIGETNIEPLQLARSLHYRAYFNMGVIGEVFNLLGLPREGLELLMGLEAVGDERPRMRPGPRSIRFLPRIIRFGLDKLLFPAKLTRFLRYLSETVREFDLEKIPQMIQEEIWDALEELHSLNLEAAYYNIVTQLSYSLYVSALRNQLEKLGLSFEDVKMGEEKIAEINPILRIERLHAMLEGMPLYKRMKIKEGEIFEAPEAFKAGFKKLLSEFGHLSERGNDFSSIPWRERPRIVLQMITDHVPVKDSDSKVYLEELKGGGFMGILTRLIYRLVVRYQIYKERISFMYTKSYGLFRPYFLRLGEIFSEWGYVDDPEDIFFLEWSEIEELVKGGPMSENLFETLSRRKRDFEILRDIDLPDVIYGEEIPELVYTGEASNEMRGVAASSGYYRGKIKVIRGSEDFWRMKKGDILVMHHSDIGWAPLFARAGAIITEAGGVLSHAATIAREYGIPAVVGVKRASKLDEDKEVLVDGFTGKILLIG